jgi:hypothetical protein
VLVAGSIINVLLHWGNVTLHPTRPLALLASNAFTHRCVTRVSLGVIIISIIHSQPSFVPPHSGFKLSYDQNQRYIKAFACVVR